jgi:nucleoside-diphosphate-sugar epimerase
MNFTILGASGFVGSHLVNYFSEREITYFAPDRDDPAIFDRHLGHVIYCIGLTADFRERPFDTVEAHVCKLMKILENTQFDSFLYLSSTRIYKNAEDTRENSLLRVTPINKDEIFNISKLMGESVCLASSKPNVRIIRPSNVYGNDYRSNNFLTAVLKEAILNKKVILRTSLESAKDYISVDDVVDLIYKIALTGKKKIYNVARGVNVTNQTLLTEIQNLTGCELEVLPQAETIIFPQISIELLMEEFDFKPLCLLEMLKELVSGYKKVELIK